MKLARILIIVSIALLLGFALFWVLHASTFSLSKSAPLAFLALAIAGMSFATQHNIGSQIKVLRGAANTAVTAGGAGDNTAVAGVIVDRASLAMPLSAVIAILFSATLAAGKKLFLKNVIVEHGDAADLSDATTFATLETADGTAIATGAVGGSTETGGKEYDVDLGGAKQYVRVKFTPDLDAANTDTAALSVALVLGGQGTLPA